MQYANELSQLSTAWLNCPDVIILTLIRKLEKPRLGHGQSGLEGRAGPRVRAKVRHHVPKLRVRAQVRNQEPAQDRGIGSVTAAR